MNASHEQQNSHDAYIALGANLGEREATLREALRRLAGSDVEIVAVSRLIETTPVGGPPGQGPYLNGAAHLRTLLEPHALLEKLLDVERQLGRQRAPGERNLPRPIDLDLLLYEERILEGGPLVLPHPRLHQRGFVLAPLAEIAPRVVHPRLKKTIAELLSALQNTQPLMIR